MNGRGLSGGETFHDPSLWRNNTSEKPPDARLASTRTPRRSLRTPHPRRVTRISCALSQVSHLSTNSRNDLLRLSISSSGALCARHYPDRLNSLNLTNQLRHEREQIPQRCRRRHAEDRCFIVLVDRDDDLHIRVHDALNCNEDIHTHPGALLPRMCKCGADPGQIYITYNMLAYLMAHCDKQSTRSP